jgi:hypothetical protein
MILRRSSLRRRPGAPGMEARVLRDYCAVSGIGFERAMIFLDDVIADFDAAVVRRCCEPVMSAFLGGDAGIVPRVGNSGRSHGG